MNRKLLSRILISGILLLVSTSTVFAHVTVEPKEVGVADSQIFSLEVPTEKDNPTVALRLVLPASLQEVTPYVKSGWTIATKKSGDKVTEISWIGGLIPTEQMDTFAFRAQVPSKETNLQWQAYQTYQDGAIVAWDQKPNGSDDSTGDKGPYSETKVVSDLTATNSKPVDQTITWVAYAALLIAAVALALSLRKQTSK